jgi:hypothetical protein
MGRPNASPGRFSVSTGEGLWVESKFQDGANGDWHHFAVTYDGVSFRLYRNGKLDVTINRLSNYTFTDAPLHIGSAVGSDLTWPFHGEMDEIRLYDRALSAPEVYALTPCSSTDGLIPLHLETTYLPHSGLSVAIKLRTGAVPDQERLRGVRMLSSDRLDAPMSEWTPVSMAPFLNGATMEASAHAVSDAPQRFYLLVE